MEAFDCPSGDELYAALRTSSITVQQALAMSRNDAFIARHCEYLAARLETLGLDDPRSSRGGRATCVRQSSGPRRTELRDLTAYADKHGLANLCLVLLNANEFLFIN